MRKDKRDSFIFYRSFYEAVKVLSKEDKADLFEAITIYALDQKNITLSPIPKAMFKLIKPQLDANYKRYSVGVKNGQKGAKYGKKGGRPKNPQITPRKPSNENVNDNVNDNVNLNERKKITKFFLAPKFKNEVYNFFLEKLDVENKEKSSAQKEKIATEEADKFHNYYEGVGWVIKGTPIAKWENVANGWFYKIDQFNKPPKPEKKEKLTGAQEFTDFIQNSMTHE